jgi:hypothetical protein
MITKYLLSGVVSLQLFVSVLAQAPSQTRTDTIVVSPTSDVPQAVALSVYGKCSYSKDGVTFSELKPGQVFNEGVTLRAGEKSRADLFFRRIGTTVRLQADTEIKLEKMTREMKDGNAALHTLLDLRSGRIFTVVRSLVPGSTLEIRNAAGRSIVEGGGSKGRYIITADGTHVTDKDSTVPLKLVRETGITVITPGQKFNAKEGKVFAADASAEVEGYISLDEIQALADELTPSVASKIQDPSQALVLSVGDDAMFSQNGEAMKKLKVGQVLNQGAIIRSGSDTVIDLFLRRWGTTVRMVANTELALEKMTRSSDKTEPALQTRLDLREGRIFCFIRIPVPDSSFEVRTKVGRTLLESAGAGRYDIRANGTIVAGQSSFKQIKVVMEHGVVTIPPGQKFLAEKGHLQPAAPSDVEMLVIQMDQLVALAEQLTIEEELTKLR